MAQSATQRTTGSTRWRGPVIVTLRGAGSKGKDYTWGGAAPVGTGLDVGLSVQVPTAQSANAIQIEQPDGTVIWAIGPTGGEILGNVNYQAFRTQKVITTAQLEALHSTPISLVAAPGAGYALRVDRATAELVFVTTAFTTAYDSYPVYHGATTALVSGKLSAAQAEGAASVLVDEGGPVAAGIACTTNTGIDYYTATNWSSSGAPDAYLVVTLDYTVVKLT